MRHRIPALALTVIAALALAAGCGDDDDSSGDNATGGGSVYGAPAEGPGDDSMSGGSAPAAQAATVDIRDFAYEPATVEVKAGGTVEWTNADSAPHTATADDDSFDTGSLDKGDSAKITFDETGTFEYI